MSAREVNALGEKR
jgi:hypothetical protein